ncbi:MAG: hypothetical protein OEZ36_11190, partial [Spirochaetota bacterium]|nr:hypothetical protein [Spirochaetota bacterium]
NEIRISFSDPSIVLQYSFNGGTLQNNNKWIAAYRIALLISMALRLRTSLNENRSPLKFGNDRVMTGKSI